MAVELLNPDGLPKPEGYWHVAVASGSRLVYLCGVPQAADGETAKGDFAAQAEQAYLNIATALEAVGGSFDDVARIDAYVVDWQPTMMAAFDEGANRAAARLGVDVIDLIKPGALLGVTALAVPDLLIELQAVAVLD